MSQDPPPTTFARVADGMAYSLGHGGHRAACRLNLQHYLWREALGYTLHPALRAALPSVQPTALADIATGSALWLLDAARTLPQSTTLLGLDIDLAQAPAARWLPENMRLEEWDLFTDPSPALHGRFDAVHLRLLITFLAPAKIPALLQRVRMLLRPGGTVQWDELDPSRIRVKHANSAHLTPGLDAIARMSRSEGRYDWTARLGHYFTSAGFEVLAEDTVDDPPHLTRAFNDQHLLTMDEFGTRLFSEGKPEAAQAFFENVRLGYQEGIEGGAICIPRMVYVVKMN